MKPKRRPRGARHRPSPDAAPGSPVSRPEAPPSAHPWIAHAYVAALRHQQSGQTEEAKQLYIRILEQDPRQSDALYFLAALAAPAGDLDLAADLLKQAIAIEPRKTPYFVLLGNVLQRRGQLELSRVCYEQALALDPCSVDAHYNLGNTLERMGANEDATRHLERAVALDPAHLEARNNLGNLYRAAGRNAEALACYEYGLQLAPSSAPLHLNSGNAHMAEGRYAEALACFDRALLVAPGLAPLHNNRGNALRQLGRYTEALEAYGRCLAADPNWTEVLVNLGHTYQALGRMQEALAMFRTVLARHADSPLAASAALFTCHYDPAMSAEALAAEHRAWGQRYGAPLARGSRPFANRPEPDRRLRVGYVSPDFRQHPVAMFTAPVLEAHDRRQVEVFAYPSNSRADEWTARCRAAADHWRPGFAWSDAELAAHVEADRIDVLIDLSGHTAGNRLLAFARQPAPVQITWLGYFNTTGLTAMHYLVGDAVITPPQESGLFTEEVLRLPGAYLCYQRPAYAPPPDRVDGPPTFGCFNALSKLTPAVVACWARILEAAPEARLLLKNNLLAEEATRRSVEEQFAAHGIGAHRLVLEPGCPHRELLSHYARVDVALDPFPYNGGTTTCEALAQGAPVVTLRGGHFVSRVGATILRHAGLAEWIAEDPAQYAALALQLAAAARRRDRAELIAHVAASPLADVASFTRHLEAAFRKAWRRWCETHG